MDLLLATRLIRRHLARARQPPIHTNIQADRIATIQYNNNNYGGGGYGQSNPYDNAPPPQYGMPRLV